MKAVFYTQLLSDAELGIGLKLIYSQLIFRAVVCDSVSFDSDGNFDMNLVREFEREWCSLDYVRLNQVAKDLNCTPRAVANSVKKLREIGLVDNEYKIYVLDNIFAGYIELRTDSGLSGWNLVIYSFIWNRTRRYKYVDTYRASLAKYFHISECHLSNVLRSLREKGLIERKSDWKNWRLSCK